MEGVPNLALEATSQQSNLLHQRGTNPMGWRWCILGGYAYGEYKAICWMLVLVLRQVIKGQWTPTRWINLLSLSCASNAIKRTKATPSLDPSASIQDWQSLSLIDYSVCAMDLVFFGARVMLTSSPEDPNDEVSVPLGLCVQFALHSVVR